MVSSPVYCAEEVGSSSSSDSTTIALAVGLGVGVPFFLIVMILAAVGIIMAVIVKKRQWGNDNWEISPSELEMEDHLGTGGYALLSALAYVRVCRHVGRGNVVVWAGTGVCTRPSGAGRRWR
jgi:hypothetical protein